MQFTTSLLALSVGLAAAVPQSPSGAVLPPGMENVPSCAYASLIALFTSSGCSSTTDTACLCSKPELFDTLQLSVGQDCPNPADQETAISYASAFCESSSISTSSAIESSTTSEEASSTTSDVASPSCGTTTPMATGGANGFNSTTTPVYTTPSLQPTETPLSAATAAKERLGMGSMIALAIAVGGMTWAFAEL